MPLAVGACKKAWQELMQYCKAATDPKTKKGCEAWREDPASFLLSRVLRATVNPIDAGYKCAPRAAPLRDRIAGWICEMYVCVFA